MAGEALLFIPVCMAQRVRKVGLAWQCTVTVGCLADVPADIFPSANLDYQYDTLCCTVKTD